MNKLKFVLRKKHYGIEINITIVYCFLIPISKNAYQSSHHFPVFSKNLPNFAEDDFLKFLPSIYKIKKDMYICGTKRFFNFSKFVNFNFKFGFFPVTGKLQLTEKLY